MAAGAENSPAILIGVENDGEDVGYLVDITGGDDGFMRRRAGALDKIGRQRVAIGIENFVFNIFIIPTRQAASPYVPAWRKDWNTCGRWDSP